MRTSLLANNTICTLLHMENMVMGIAFGTAVSNIRKGHIENFNGTYNLIKLNDIKNEKQTFKEFAECKSGIMTGSDIYIKLWFEVEIGKIGFLCNSYEDMGEYKWFPLNSGGEYRKYYGNNSKVVDLWHDGFNIRIVKCALHVEIKGFAGRA